MQHWTEAAEEATTLHHQMIEARVAMWEADEVALAAHSRYQQIRAAWQEKETTADELFWREQMYGSGGYAPVRDCKGQQVASKQQEIDG